MIIQIFVFFHVFFVVFCYLRGLHGQSNQRAGRAKSSRAQRSPRLFHNHASKYITHHKLEMTFFSFSMLVVVLVSIFVTVLQMQILVLGCQRTQFHWILLLNGLMLDNPLLCIESLHHCIIHFSQSKLVVVNLCDHLQRYLKSKDYKLQNCKIAKKLNNQYWKHDKNLQTKCCWKIDWAYRLKRAKRKYKLEQYKTIKLRAHLASLYHTLLLLLAHCCCQKEWIVSEQEGM